MSVLVATALAVGVAAPTCGQVINEDLKLLANDGAEKDRFHSNGTIDPYPEAASLTDLKKIVLALRPNWLTWSKKQ